MSEVTISYTEKVPGNVEARRNEDLVRYETSHGVKLSYRKFALLLNDDSNNTIGALEGYTAYAEIATSVTARSSSGYWRGNIVMRGSTISTWSQVHFRQQISTENVVL